MNLPQPVKLIHIMSSNREKRTICFSAAPELVETIRQAGFGRLDHDVDAAEYELTVNDIYSFEHVLEWLHAQAEQ